MSDSLFAKIQGLPTLSNMHTIKKNLLMVIMHDELLHIESIKEQIFIEHSAFFTECAAIILFKKRRYNTDLFGEEQELHPSLHLRMNQWIALHRHASNQINVFDNFLTAVLMKAKTVADGEALLPAFLHRAYRNNIDDYVPLLTAQCLIPGPWLKASEHEAFLKQHASVLHEIKTMQLNQLTL